MSGEIRTDGHSIYSIIYYAHTMVIGNRTHDAVVRKWRRKTGFKLTSKYMFDSTQDLHLKFYFCKIFFFASIDGECTTRVCRFSWLMRRYWFYVKNKFGNFHWIFTLLSPRVRKNGFYESICLSVVGRRYRIIGLDCALAYFIEAQKLRIISFRNLIWLKLLK